MILRQNLLDAPQLTELGQLTTLKHLDLYGNQLTTAEIGIENCTNLEYVFEINIYNGIIFLQFIKLQECLMFHSIK